MLNSHLSSRLLTEQTTHNGDVYIYMTVNKPFTSKLFDRTVDKYKDRPYNMNEQDAYIATLNCFEEDYGIKWAVR